MSINPASPYVPDPPSPELGDDLFSRKFKPWREWSNTVDFLTNLHIGVDDSKVLCSPTDPPDVLYMDAAFEVKEIMNPGRRRHDEVKAQKATSRSKPTLRMHSIRDLSPVDVGNILFDRLGEIAGKYQEDVRQKTDLLFYVNLLEHWFLDGEMPESKRFSAFGWRSISALVAKNVSLVFFTDSHAPDFLINSCGTVQKRFVRNFMID